MAPRIRELPDSPEITTEPASATRKFLATGLDNEVAVQALAMQVCSEVFLTANAMLFRQDLRIARQGHRVYQVTVPYAARKRQQGSWRFTFDTTGGTVHIKASKETVGKFPNTAPDHKQLIGVNGTEVAGVDIVVPAARFSIHFNHPAGIITLNKFFFLADVTAYVNSDTFFGRPPGSILFLGASGGDGSDAPAEIKYDFAYSRNATGLTIGDIANVVKDGHDAAWIQYKPSVDGGKPAMIPEYCYVERVYERTSLSAALGFGG